MVKLRQEGVQSLCNFVCCEEEIGKTLLTQFNDSFKKIIVVRDPIKAIHDEHGITTIGIVEFLSNINSMDL